MVQKFLECNRFLSTEIKEYKSLKESHNRSHPSWMKIYFSFLSSQNKRPFKKNFSYSVTLLSFSLQWFFSPVHYDLYIRVKIKSEDKIRNWHLLKLESFLFFVSLRKIVIFLITRYNRVQNLTKFIWSTVKWSFRWRHLIKSNTSEP